MTDETHPLDLDRIADLRLRLCHTHEPDRALGCAIITLLLPGTIAAGAAKAWLAQSEVIGSGLDITGSVDDALRFLGQLGFGPGWSIIREELGDECSSPSEGRHCAWLRHRFFGCVGSGHTAAVALVDVAIHATALGAAGYEEEDLPPLVSRGGSTRTDDESMSSEVGAASELNAGWSDDPVERTQQVLAEFWPNLDIRGRICLKNSNGRFGTMDGYELHAGILRVVDRDAVMSMRFVSVEDLLAAGWVID